MCVSPWFNDKYKSYIPCGGCIGCRLDRVSLWSCRASSEAKKGRNAFVTFTYDDYHLPYSDSSLLPTLRSEHNKKFLDKICHLVKKMPFLPEGCYRDYKYYSVGEYGDSFQRPHYHILFFGLDFHDFDSFFSKNWSFGSVKSLPVNSSTIRYVLDYMFKSTNGSLAKELFDDTNRERPFSSNSKGFGLDFFKSKSDEINKFGFVKIAGRFVPIPTYYKNMFCKLDSDSINSRASFAFNSYRKNEDIALSKGFKTLDDYLNYNRDVFFKSQFSKSVASGRGVDSSYILQDKDFSSDVLPFFD